MWHDTKKNIYRSFYPQPQNSKTTFPSELVILPTILNWTCVYRWERQTWSELISDLPWTIFSFERSANWWHCVDSPTHSLVIWDRCSSSATWSTSCNTNIAYTVDTLWMTMTNKISSLSGAALQIAAYWYGHPVRYGSSRAWCRHITKYSSSNLSSTNDALWPSFLTLSPAIWATLQIPILVVRSHMSCPLVICWESSMAFQSISSSQNTGRDRSPDIFINSWTRSRNFRVSQSLTIGISLRNTRGAYSITMNQWRTSLWVILYLTISWEQGCFS